MGTHESVKSYSLRLKKLARALPEDRMEEVLHPRFVTGLLPHMRKDAALVSGSYDQVVSKVAGLEAFRRRKLEPLRPSKETVEFADKEGGGRSTTTREL
jgi:hypothetical protein